MVIYMYMDYKNQQYSYMMTRQNIVQDVITLGLGIYFAWGAPGFVRWQVKKTLQQCGNFEEQKSH
jgi:hypothetical protein